MEKVIIIGGKSSATLIADYIYDAQHKYNMPIECLGFAYDNEPVGTDINGFPVLCNVADVYSEYENDKNVKFIFQMYDIQDMLKTIEFKDSLGIPEDRYCTFIHPSCFIARSSEIGAGTVILAHSVVNPKAKIGKFNTFVSGVTIGHDAVVGDYNLVATQAIIANVIMGSRNFVGINATTNNKITIGDDCQIGMASNVVKDVPSGTKCFGNPAKPVDTPKRLR
ncbi:MAG: acetyltransferase [Chitinophagaceae bacterium]|nr:acetyltransferase [Chitinophagaceae bacterium]MCW5905655.1 acetyltransferase [Chitinophagaceae bacterium]